MDNFRNGKGEGDGNLVFFSFFYNSDYVLNGLIRLIGRTEYIGSLRESSFYRNVDGIIIVG